MLFSNLTALTTGVKLELESSICLAVEVRVASKKNEGTWFWRLTNWPFDLSRAKSKSKIVSIEFGSLFSCELLSWTNKLVSEGKYELIFAPNSFESFDLFKSCWKSTGLIMLGSVGFEVVKFWSLKFVTLAETKFLTCSLSLLVICCKEKLNSAIKIVDSLTKETTCS